MQRSPTPPGPSPPHHSGVDDVAFRVFGARRHPDWPFRGSILCLHVPLSTLHEPRYRGSRMTRGQRGWLDLRCQGLAPFTTVPACPGADPNAGGEPRPMAEATQERKLLGVGSSALIMIEASPAAYPGGMLALGKSHSRTRRRPHCDSTPISTPFTAVSTCMPGVCPSAS